MGFESAQSPQRNEQGLCDRKRDDAFGQRGGLPAGGSAVAHRGDPFRPCCKVGRGWNGFDTGSEEEAFIKLLLADISNNSGKSVVAVGSQHEPALHALALAINDKIGAIGSTITLVEEPEEVSHFDSIADLAKRLKAKQINTLVILGGNPVYDAPPI